MKILDPGLVPDHSFPSGHMATSIVVYCALAIYLIRDRRRCGALGVARCSSPR